MKQRLFSDPKQAIPSQNENWFWERWRKYNIYIPNL